jgi:hypothetical protein
MSASAGEDMFDDVRAGSIAAFHDTALQTRQWAKVIPPRHASGAWKYIELNHRYNSMLWDEEELARRLNAADAEIARSMRAIDGFRRKRDETVERIDESLLMRLGAVARRPEARLSSETPGAMCDRLSVLALKIHAMRGTAHAGAAKPNALLDKLVEQRADLASCLDALLRDVQAGTATFKIYR